MNSQAPHVEAPHVEAQHRQDLQSAELVKLTRPELEDLLTGTANPMLTLKERAAIEAELDRRGYRVLESHR